MWLLGCPGPAGEALGGMRQCGVEHCPQPSDPGDTPGLRLLRGHKVAAQLGTEEEHY